MSTMAYKWNYLLGVGFGLANMATDLVYIWFLFYLAGGQVVAGVNYMTMFFAFGMMGVVRSIMNAGVSDNSYFVQSGIHTGELDEFLIKPVNFKFITSVRFFWLEQLLYGLASLIFVIVISWLNNWFGWSLQEAVWLLFIMVSSVVIYFLVIWIISLLAFYWDKFRQIKLIFWTSGEASYYPRKLYPPILQWIGVYLFPVFMIVNPIFDVFDGSYDWVKVINTILYIGVLFIIYQMVWKFGLRKYNSAN